MLLGFFPSSRTGALALLLGCIVCAGCTLDFDRFAPLPGSSADGGTSPSLEAGNVEDVTTTNPDDASGGVESGSVTDAGQVGSGDARTDGAACTETRAVSFGGHCYFALTSRSNWMAASTTCQASGAHLVTIGSAEEQAAVAAISTTQDRWMGLTRPANSLPLAAAYEWITGEAMDYTHWGNGEPNFTGECVRMMQGGTWADNPCTTSYYAICERE